MGEELWRWPRLRRVAASADSLRVQLACQPKRHEEGSDPEWREGWRPHRDSNPGFGLERATS